MMDNKAYLILENGTIFEGKSFGANTEVVGEIVFTTAMTGYLETLTDPSYFGQIVVQTFPLIGNYGVIPADFECDSPKLKAYIVKDWCQQPSNFRSEGCLDTFLKEKNVVGLYGIDTRALTKIVRESGVMNGKIVTGESGLGFEDLKKFAVVDAVKSVTPSEIIVHKPEKAEYKVALMNFGAKANIARELVARGCEVIDFPAYTSVEEVMKHNPDGIMLSNGPGDPSENTQIAENIKKFFEIKIPMFGICLGHQLLALAKGAKTTKLKYGHRGANQPVLNKDTGRIYITSQNHGYAVMEETLPEDAVANYTNVNDSTCEGVKYLNEPVFSVQFHPEAAAGPLDTRFLFDDFIALMQGGKK